MTMKLSEAILMNGMTKPQGFGGESFSSPDAPCALGGALQSVGRQLVGRLSVDVNYLAVGELWPWTRKEAFCPMCADVDDLHVRFIAVIWHLNDEHRWTRAQIAEWVASVEPKEPTETPIDIPAFLEEFALAND
jgi:hypothetical protein